MRKKIFLYLIALMTIAGSVSADSNNETRGLVDDPLTQDECDWMRIYYRDKAFAEPDGKVISSPGNVVFVREMYRVVNDHKQSLIMIGWKEDKTGLVIISDTETFTVKDIYDIGRIKLGCNTHAFLLTTHAVPMAIEIPLQPYCYEYDDKTICNVQGAANGFFAALMELQIIDNFRAVPNTCSKYFKAGQKLQSFRGNEDLASDSEYTERAEEGR